MRKVEVVSSKGVEFVSVVDAVRNVAFGSAYQIGTYIIPDGESEKRIMTKEERRGIIDLIGILAEE